MPCKSERGHRLLNVTPVPSTAKFKKRAVKNQ